VDDDLNRRFSATFDMLPRRRAACLLAIVDSRAWPDIAPGSYGIDVAEVELRLGDGLNCTHRALDDRPPMIIGARRIERAEAERPAANPSTTPCVAPAPTDRPVPR
jgi:hypothetical protein